MSLATLSSPLAEDLLRDSQQAARAASLRYVSDRQGGIRRLRAGRGFTYRDAEGKPIRDPQTLERIRRLAIPPAWTDVWICASENGHLQASGRDARGRKQYRYHPRWTEVRDSAKYERLAAFAAALPKIRRRVRADLALPGIPRGKVLAVIVKLLETTFIRVGNEEYAKTNGSYGLTTMRTRHAKTSGARIRFQFRGKSGVPHTIEVTDRRLAAVVKRCQELPGQELFQYLDDSGQPQPIDSADVNDYLRQASGEDFTAKDFRTWAGTLLAAGVLCQQEAMVGEVDAAEQNGAVDRSTARARKRAIVDAVKRVAQQLGNTASVCRKCYIHPRVLDAFAEGSLASLMQRGAGGGALRKQERSLLALLRASSARSRRLRRPGRNGAVLQRAVRKSARAPNQRPVARAS